MSITSISTTCCDPLFCLIPDCSANYLKKASKCSICSENSQNIELSEDNISEGDPSRINYFDVDVNPSTSTFSQSDHYGEPLTSQALTIDFTPVEGVDDNEILVKKCIDFWNFIEKNPKLHKLCAMPEPSQSSSSEIDKEEEEEEEEESIESSENDSHNEHALYWLNNDNIVDATFATKALKPPPCELRRGDYIISHESPAQRRDNAKAVNLLRRSVNSKPKNADNQFMSRSPLEVHKLCREMEEWDLTHPKSMLPPCSPPRLIHAVLQRKPLI